MVPMPKKLRGVFTFFRNFWIAMLLLSVACSYTVIANRTTIPVLLFGWAKICADLILLYFWYHLRRPQLYFYYNIGLRKRDLFASAIVIDICSFSMIQFFTVLWL
jgi:hypothetical protein